MKNFLPMLNIIMPIIYTTMIPGIITLMLSRHQRVSSIETFRFQEIYNLFKELQTTIVQMVAAVAPHKREDSFVDFIETKVLMASQTITKLCSFLENDYFDKYSQSLNRLRILTEFLTATEHTINHIEAEDSVDAANALYHELHAFCRRPLLQSYDYIVALRQEASLNYNQLQKLRCSLGESIASLIKQLEIRTNHLMMEQMFSLTNQYCGVKKSLTKVLKLDKVTK